jgi:hypothetical protein
VAASWRVWAAFGRRVAGENAGRLVGRSRCRLCSGRGTVDAASRSASVAALYSPQRPQSSFLTHTLIQTHVSESDTPTPRHLLTPRAVPPRPPPTPAHVRESSGPNVRGGAGAVTAVSHQALRGSSSRLLSLSMPSSICSTRCSMCGRLSARTCILSAIRLAVACVAVEGAGRASEFERDVLDTRFEDVRVGAERRGSFIAAPLWCSMRAAVVADLAQEAGLYFTPFHGPTAAHACDVPSMECLFRPDERRVTAVIRRRFSAARSPSETLAARPCRKYRPRGNSEVVGFAWSSRFARVLSARWKSQTNRRCRCSETKSAVPPRPAFWLQPPQPHSRSRIRRLFQRENPPGHRGTPAPRHRW